MFVLELPCTTCGFHLLVDDAIANTEVPQELIKLTECLITGRTISRTSKHMFSPSLSQSSHKTILSQSFASFDKNLKFHKKFVWSIVATTVVRKDDQKSVSTVSQRQEQNFPQKILSTTFLGSPVRPNSII